MGDGGESERLEDIRMQIIPRTELQRRHYWRVPEDGLARTDCEKISYSCYCLANQLVEECPPGRNLSLALTALEDVRMRACAAIVLDKKT